MHSRNTKEIQNDFYSQVKFFLLLIISIFPFMFHSQANIPPLLQDVFRNIFIVRQTTVPFWDKQKCQTR